MQLTDEEHEEIAEAIYAGRKIEAIKLYRQATGQGLKESKDFVEALTERLREENPDKVPPPKRGCGPAALLLIALAAVVDWLVILRILDEAR